MIFFFGVLRDRDIYPDSDSENPGPRRRVGALSAVHGGPPADLS